ncbi:MAG: ABC transporter ATP-binding protein [Candidatus Bathyarchaeota archaeon]|nr:MAG: ABC transporter ATP-binding protein [Candidatus Bathyarchaeota archaeon]
MQPNNNKKEKPTVQTKNLSKTYRLGEIEVQALRNVNLQINRSEFIALMGPSGSGKTTLLNLIGTLDTPTEGEVILDGEDLSKLTESEKDRIRRYKIGFVYQFYNLIPVLSARENVELPMDIAGVDDKKINDRVDQLLSMVGLRDRANHRPDELSGGEQQRVAIARALANGPSLILADEPTGDLDSKTGKEVIGQLKKICKEEHVTAIVVTHDPIIGEYSDRLICMRDGTIEGERTGPCI